MGKILGLPCKLDRLSKSFVKILKKHFISFLLIVPWPTLAFDFVKCRK